MKKLISLLLILVSLFSFSACSSNAVDNNYENTDPSSQSERLYEEEMDDPALSTDLGGTGYVSD